jgi:hypothetical protein
LPLFRNRQERAGKADLVAAVGAMTIGGTLAAVTSADELPPPPHPDGASAPSVIADASRALQGRIASLFFKGDSPHLMVQKTNQAGVCMARRRPTIPVGK